MTSGHFVLIDPNKGELKRVRAVPGNKERNERIQAQLRQGAGEGCYVDFRPDS